MADSRFARLHTDPRFRRPKKANQKVVVDERFKSIFEDTDPKNSKSKKSKAGRVDKYGRHLPDSHDKDNLKRFYKLEDSTTEDSKPKKSSSAEAKEPKFVDYARGEVLLESSDEEDSDIRQQKDDQESNIDNSDDDDGDDDDDENETGPIILGRHISKPIPILANEDLSDSDSENLEVDLNEDIDNTDLYAELEAQAAAYTQTDDEAANANDDNDGDDSDDENAVVKTSRLAVVNLDWDHVRASHLYKIFSSLVSPSAPALIPSTKTEEKPSKTKKGGKRRKNGKEEASEPSGPKIVCGRILSVRIYPSQFGKERLRKEEVEGPPKEIFKRPQKREEAELTGSLIQEDDGEEYNEKALRKYQLERLRYYYAIVTCDTPSAASHILSELDGTELERSANVFDLSYVPSDMTFDDPPRDEATPSSESSSSLTASLDPAGAGANYRPLDFSTDALRHSKVQLKWDEDDPERNKVTRRTLTKKEIDEGDFRGLIASSSGESGSESEGEDINGKQKKTKTTKTTAKESAKEKGKAERERLRKLLLGGGKDEMPEGWDRTDPFGSGDFDGDSEDGGRVEGDMEITFLPGLSEVNTNAEETTLGKYKRKQKEKRQARKKELKEKKDGGERSKENEREKEGKKKKKGVDDDFFAQDSDEEEEEEEEEKENKKSKKERSKSKNGKKGGRDETENGSDSETDIDSRRPATEAELELLVAPDDTQDSGGIHNHFDMKSIIKAEKTKGKSKKFKNKKRNKQGEEEELQEDFQIDVKDDRFKALHEDHTFAIDPSNPHFKKTKSMVALLDERSKRRQHTRDDNDRSDIRSARGSKNQNQNEDTSSAPQQSLKSLVESVKRKSNHSDGKGVGKRQRL